MNVMLFMTRPTIVHQVQKPIGACDDDNLCINPSTCKSAW